ncbi:hypothetical protein KUV26_06945 [Leisingera daeponensis]|uniref:Lipoprotein n=1 Tax=Leisingera daeponensis TaxID=405746 RepID=A0ABS7ND86_9RHOB|nr:hypothetical protein [Leisingera daeponensis]MBY6057807.1 hypothetical protein [Leisingera daeponensis]MBY6139174.1 hypothetical protein [Leisingera daeponensis]
MKLTSVIAAALAGTILTGCEEFEGEQAQEVTPPEYYPCRELPQAIAQADAVVRNPDRLSANEQNYWFDRKDRLVKRAWECKA